MKTILIKEILKKSWINTKSNIWFLISSTFVFFIISSILNDDYNKDLGSFLLFLAGMIVSMLFSIGMYRTGLLLEENKKPSINNFKSTPQTFLNFLLASIISGILTVLGLILFIVPGVILSIRFSMTSYVLLDKNLGPWESIKQSWDITRGFSFKIIQLFLIYVVLVLLSFLTFGLGFVLLVPYVYLTGAVFYRSILKTKEDSTVSDSKELNSTEN